MTTIAAGPPPSGAADISLAVGRQAIAASDPKLRDAVVAANHQHNVAGLAEALNPDMLDPDKVSRFAAALPKQSAATLAKLKDGALVLDWPALGLGTATPTRPDAFARPFDLIVDEVANGKVYGHTTVPMDAALSKARAAEAKAAFEAAHADVLANEAKQPLPAATSGIRWRRSQAAYTWRLNATVWSKAEPQNAAATAALAEAKQATSDYTMPSGGLAP